MNLREAISKSSVVIVGGDHHNTLSVMRCFGMNKVDYEVLVQDDNKRKKRLNVSYSKYAKNIQRIEDTEDALLNALNKIKGEHKKAIIPCSDLSAYVIDKHYAELSEHYFIPGFVGNPGLVVKLMDKYEQSKLAQEIGISIPKTWHITIPVDSFPMDMVYPCIVKPEVSAAGRKTDILICQTHKELADALEVYKSKGYKTVLVQKYIIKLYEALAMGCVCDNQDNNCGTIIKKEREYPIDKGGSTSFGVVVNNPKVNEIHKVLIDALWKLGYRGQYDIEYFVCEDHVYLNEINFRHSGSGYVLIYNGVYAPLVSALSLQEADLDKLDYAKTLTEEKFNMCEIQDARYVKLKRISLGTFLKDMRKASAYAYFHNKDMRGAWGFYSEVVKEKLTKFRGRK